MKISTGIASVIFLVVSSLGFGEQQYLDFAPGINEIRIPIEGDCDVDWEVREPVGVKYFVYQLAGGESAFVLSVAPDRTYTIVSDVIYWAEHRREKTTWLVNVGDHPPAVDEDTRPDSPPEVELSEFASQVRNLARAVSKPREAATIADNLHSVVQQIDNGELLSFEQVAGKVSDKNKGSNLSTGWKSCGTYIGRALNKATNLDEVRTILTESINGLRAAR